MSSTNRLNVLAGLLLALSLAFGVVPLRAVAATAEVTWLPAATDADVDRAFAQARGEGKPLLLYWGAKWCPPCNQLKATLFNRQDFIERSRAFVPVYADGDLPGAQKLGTRFKVRGYPTLILFSPGGAELTRLPGEADAPQVMQALQLGLSGGRPVKAVLADAQAGKALKANEWRMLAYYAWDTDEAQLVPETERAALLVSLAAACPAGESQAATRLWLKALAASDDGKGVRADAALRERVMKVLADPLAARAHMDVLTNWPTEITRAITTKDAGGRRAAVLVAYDSALRRLEADATLSRADRMGALLARVELARIDLPKDAKAVKMPAALLEGPARAGGTRRPRDRGRLRAPGRDHDRRPCARAGRARRRVGRAAQGQPREEPLALLPHVRARGQREGARRQGRGAALVRAGVRQQRRPRNAPAMGRELPQRPRRAVAEDAPRIERTASRLIGEAAAQPDAFYERSARSLQRVARKLQAWNGDGAHADVIKRLQAQLSPVCAKLPADDAQRSTCQALLRDRPDAA